MWGTAKGIVVAFISGMMTFLLFNLIFNIPPLSPTGQTVAISIFGLLGLILLVIGLLSNIKRQSKAKLGTINRAEFYGMVTILLSVMLYMNTRIDQIMIMLVQYPLK